MVLKLQNKINFMVCTYFFKQYLFKWLEMLEGVGVISSLAHKWQKQIITVDRTNHTIKKS